jgi:hypothetical protein
MEGYLIIHVTITVYMTDGDYGLTSFHFVNMTSTSHHAPLVCSVINVCQKSVTLALCDKIPFR